MVGGQQIGWMSVVAGRKTATVTGEAAFLAWAREHHPTEVVTVEIVRPSFAANVLAAVKDKGGWLDKETGEVVPVPGVTEGEGDPYPKVDPFDTAGEIIGEAWRAGKVDLPGVLALPPAGGGLREAS
jgi:hypothetical protein